MLCLRHVFRNLKIGKEKRLRDTAWQCFQIFGHDNFDIIIYLFRFSRLAAISKHCLFPS